MTPEQAKALRAKFPAAAIGKLPKPKTKDAPKGHCNECGGWHGLPAVHLDYVGHAATTDRLLEVDPEWSWEPMAVGPNGEPLMTNGGLWIKLTVAGVTRPGFGDGQSVKECIGDAIRNAAMRFGVALDLWAKEDLHADTDDAKVSRGAPVPRGSGDTPPGSGGEPTEKAPAAVPAADHAKFGRYLANLQKVSDRDWDALADTYCAKTLNTPRDLLTAEQMEQLVKHLAGKLDALDKAKLRDLQAAGT